MQESVIISMTPEKAAVEAEVRQEACSQLNIDPLRVNGIRIERRTVDARQRQPKVNMTVRLFVDEKMADEYRIADSAKYRDVSNSPKVIIVGEGPAGLFAALRLIELGVKPVVVERGKCVSERKKDIAIASRNKGLNTESNFSFGEGGAGAFSDGKLYTRSKKKGNIGRILQIFHDHGAQDEILYEAHPHIGTDVLSVVIKNMRQTILNHGGEVHYETRMTDLIIDNNEVRGIKTANGDEYMADAVILATGHSARDVYEMLDRRGIEIEQKGFAMGVRVEHPQALIDSIQYHRRSRGKYLPAAMYNIVAQSGGRGVYSFCMCPGGQIVAASTEEDGIVVNGMSNSLRNSPYANSGIVVEIRPEDVDRTEWQRYGNLAGMMLQKHVEQLAYRSNGGLGLVAPAQRLADFVKGRLSSDLPDCSYLPGVISTPMHFWLPQFIGQRLQDGFRQFDKKMHGFLTNEALIVGVESRSSSPVRIPRNRETLEHIRIKGLFPCGEGAGYSGGITSSGVDGELCAEKAAERVLEM